jgi:HEPN domain-containing protein
MPLEQRDSTDPQEWLRRARSNLAKAKHAPGSPEILYEDLCFDAQQAAEKAIKALLVHRKIAFPKTHDIALLLTLASRAGIEVPEEMRQVDRLTRFAGAMRYASLAEGTTEEAYTRAVQLAEGAYRWVESLMIG